MKPQNKLLLLAVFIFQMLQSNAQSVNPPLYSADWRIQDLESKGDTLFVGGWFNHVGKYSQGMALFTTTNDQASPNLVKINEGIVSATADGNGGYYIYTYNYEIKHILPNLTLDPNFLITITGGWLYENRILYHNGLLYVGGNQSVNYLTAFDVTTQQPVTTLPTVNNRIKNMKLFGNSLYIVGEFTTVGGLVRDQIAEIDVTTNTVTNWNFQDRNCYSGGWSCEDVALYGNEIIVGGSFTATCQGGGLGGGGIIYHCIMMDKITGVRTRQIFPDAGLFGGTLDQIYWAASVYRVAVSGNLLYAYSAGTFDTRLTAVNLTTNAIIWARFFNMTAFSTPDVVATSNGVFVGGIGFEEIFQLNMPNDAQYFESNIWSLVKLNPITGAVENWNGNPANNDVTTLVLSGNDLFVGGRFTHVNSYRRKGFYAINASSDSVLPYRLDYNYIHEVNDMEFIGDTLYLAGEFDMDYWDTLPPKTIVALSLSTVQEIPLNIPYVGIAKKIAIAGSKIFIGGQVNDTSGGITKNNLLAIDRYSGQVANWSPNPDIGGAQSFHITDGRLYVGGNFITISGQSRDAVAAYDLNNLSLLNWQPAATGAMVRTLQSDDSLIYLGGDYVWDAGSTGGYFAALRKSDGSLVRYAPYNNMSSVDIHDMILKNEVVITCGESFNPTCGNVSVYKGDSLLYKESNPCITVSEGNQIVYAIELIGNDLYYAGDFLRTNNVLTGSNIGRITFPIGYFNDSVTSIKPLSLLPKVKIYPNPTNGNIYIQTDDVVTNEILSLDGRIVFPKNNKKAIDISFLPSGIYIVHCYNKEGLKIQSEKIVKQ